MIKNCVAYSNKDDKTEAFDEIKRQIDAYGTPMLIIFSSFVDDFNFYSLKFHINFKEATVVGSTSFVSFSNKGYGEKSLAALAIFEGIECSSGVIFETARYPLRYASVIESALKELNGYENTICLEYTTSTGKCEELVQDTYRSVLEHRHVQVIGGTAGAKDMTGRTYVSLNGTVFDDSSVFVFIKNLGGRILTYKENIFKPTTSYFTATDVDCDERRVYEINGKPARDYLAMLLDVEPQELVTKLTEHPIGRMTKDETYITDCEKVFEDGSISYYARVYNRTRLALLELDEVEKVWNETAANISYEIDSPSMSIFINCYGREMYFKRAGIEDSFFEKLNKEYGNFIGTVGFGEQINYEHFNETMVIAVFE